jgi:hypothetical protein
MKTKTKPEQAEQTTVRVTPSKIEPELIGVDEAQVLTGVSKWTWRFAAYNGKVESVKLGRRLLIPLSEVRRLISEGTRRRKDGRDAGAPAAPKQRKEEVRA